MSLARLLALGLVALLATLAVLAAPAPAQDAQDDATVREFKMFYDKDKSDQERYEAVRELEGIDSLGAAKALIIALEDDAFSVREAAVTVLATHTKPETVAWLTENVLENRKLAKNEVLVAGVLEGMGGIGASGTASEGVYTALMEAVDDKRLPVQLAAVAGLGRLGDARAAPKLSEVSTSTDGATALAAVDALVEIGDGEAATEAVVGALRHDDFRVRARAIAAVWDLKLKAGIRGLIERMAEEEGRLRGDAFDTLKRITRRQISDKPEDWFAWWDRNESRWELPDFEAIAAAEKKAAIEGTQYSAGGKQFLGVETKSEKITFVIDVSDSMNIPFGDPERLKALGREYSSTQRLAIVKEELIATIDSLPDSTRFNIMAYATDIDLWKKKLAKASVLNKNNAKTWVSKLEPKGGTGSGFRARTGLSDLSANEGQTNTHLALLSALGEEVGERRKGPQVFETDAEREPVDTIFFLTDGEPTVGEIVDMVRIRSEVRRVNQYKGVQIHVIYVGTFGGDDFQLLAEENGGVFVSIGG